MTAQAIIRKVGGIWGVGGVAVLLGFAMYRLLPFALEVFSSNLMSWQILILCIWCLFMLYTEGYKAFAQQFSPRVVARAQYVARHGTWIEVILAPLFCAGYFNAPKKRIITVCILAVGIVMLIIVVHFVPQPWRGIIDFGVVLGLVAGIISLGVYSVRAFSKSHGYITDPEVATKWFTFK